MPNLFAASINISPLDDAEAIFEQGGGRKYKIIKFRFDPKLPIICINQKCSMVDCQRVFAHFLFIESKGVWGRAPNV